MTGRWVRRVAGAAVMTVVAAGSASAQDTFEWSGRVGADGVLKVRGISGTVRAEPTSGATARVTAEKRGRSGDFEEVEIVMEQDGDDVIVCAVYGSWNHGDGCDGERWGDGDRRERRRSIDVEVDFVVHLPTGVPLSAAMVNGDIDIVDVRSDVRANTVNGDIVISTSGVARAQTVSGSVDVSMGSDDWEDLDFQTVSGDVTIRMPEGLDTDVSFSSLSGDFRSDFDVAMERRSGRRWQVGSRVRGTIGDGGRSLSVQTVSGDLRLLRGR